MVERIDRRDFLRRTKRAAIGVIGLVLIGSDLMACTADDEASFERETADFRYVVRVTSHIPNILPGNLLLPGPPTKFDTLFYTNSEPKIRPDQISSILVLDNAYEYDTRLRKVAVALKHRPHQEIEIRNPEDLKIIDRFPQRKNP